VRLFGKFVFHDFYSSMKIQNWSNGTAVILFSMLAHFAAVKVVAVACQYGLDSFDRIPDGRGGLARQAGQAPPPPDRGLELDQFGLHLSGRRG
jgi:hypothetical protein